MAALAPELAVNVDGYRVLAFGGFYLVIDSRTDVADKNPNPDG